MPGHLPPCKDARGGCEGMATRLGIGLWSQSTDWASFEAAARRVDELGYDHLWTIDHLLAIYGDPYQPIFEGYLALAAWSKITTRVGLGLLVGANTLRNPGLVAKMVATLDHASGGRAMLGMGGAWFEPEHTAYGIDFGRGFGDRLDWLDESVAAIHGLFAGEEVSSPAQGHYQFDRLRLEPPPVQSRIPILIGGSGERKTLRTVARYADMWNGDGSVELLRHKLDVLERHCAQVGRDPGQIELTCGLKPVIRDDAREARRVWERQMTHNQWPITEAEQDDSFWIGTPDQIAGMMVERRDLGFHTFIAEMAAPFDDETLDRWIGEVRPMVDSA
jgi:alkanesulfonate monooxygenase SsuD/methylene tetrahydromethanopterin reductase-like flavin-dependent oxidoreductase (luciferase family)